MKVSLKQISEATGYSLATVSNALHNKHGVKAETAAEIWRVAMEYGYAPERKITNIKVVTYRDSGGVFSDTPFFSLLMESVENEAHKCGYATTIYNLYRHNDDYGTRLQQLLEDKSSAILLIGTELNEQDAQVFYGWDGPLLVLDAKFDNLDFNAVLMNNEESVRQAIDYLVKQGHTRIGHLRGNVRINNFICRERGFRMALLDYELPTDCCDITVTPSIVGSYEGMQEFLQSGQELPTAFFADNDMIALGAMKAMQENGLRIPEDISIIGFDDIPFCEVFSPGLTTVKVFKKELGEMAVHRLMEIIQNPPKQRICTQLYNELVIRGSVAKPAQSK